VIAISNGDRNEYGKGLLARFLLWDTRKESIMVKKTIDDAIFNDLFGKAKSLKGARTIANILDSCLDVIEKEGWSNITQEKVAKRAGIKAGTLRYYYPVKEDLVAATIKHLVQYIKGLLTEAIDDSLSDPLDKFLNFIDTILIANEKISEVLIWELWAYSVHDKMANKMMGEYYDWITEQIVGMLTAIAPELDKNTLLCRAVSVISLTDGAHVFIGKSRPKKLKPKNLRKVYRESILKIVGIDPVEIDNRKKRP
jgi:AcrR family transcriptional regulator